MTQKSSKLTLGMLGKVFGVAFFVYLFSASCSCHA